MAPEWGLQRATRVSPAERRGWRAAYRLRRPHSSASFQRFPEWPLSHVLPPLPISMPRPNTGFSHLRGLHPQLWIPGARRPLLQPLCEAEACLPHPQGQLSPEPARAAGAKSSQSPEPSQAPASRPRCLSRNPQRFLSEHAVRTPSIFPCGKMWTSDVETRIIFALIK